MLFVPNPAGITDVLYSPTGITGRHLLSLGRKVSILAKRDVGVRTGKLRLSIGSRMKMEASGLVVLIGSDNRIALLHHEGSRRHIIVPRYAKALRFRWHGRLVVTQKVRHPGTQPNRYLTTNLARVVLSN